MITLSRLSNIVLAIAVVCAVGCARNSNSVPVQPISDWDAAQIGAKSMNQWESWEPNVVYETRRDGKFWRIFGYKTRGNDLHNHPIYVPGVYRVIKISPYGRVIDFWRVAPAVAAK